MKENEQVAKIATSSLKQSSTMKKKQPDKKQKTNKKPKTTTTKNTWPKWMIWDHSAWLWKRQEYNSISIKAIATKIITASHQIENATDYKIHHYFIYQQREKVNN